MSEAWFEYKGINSLDMHLRIVNDVSFASPEADIELVEIMGKDGDLIVDNQRLKSVPMSFPVQLRLPDGLDVNEASTRISNWLKSDIGWHTLRFSGSDKYEYTAVCYEQFDTVEILKRYGKLVITFTLKPFKRLIGGNTHVLSSGDILYNPEKRVSKPLIHIEGSGNIDILNNGNPWLSLRSVDGHITIDSEMMAVYKGNRNAFNKMVGLIRPMFPLLHEGENKLTWTGNVTKISVKPRWEAIT